MGFDLGSCVPGMVGEQCEKTDDCLQYNTLNVTCQNGKCMCESNGKPYTMTISYGYRITVCVDNNGKLEFHAVY